MYSIQSAAFSGPLDLLLKLIEENKLEITKVSLAQVTEEYLGEVRKMEEANSDELADFLVVAAKLMYIKSKELLPYLVFDEEDGEVGLADQLRMYKIFVEAAKVINKMVGSGNYSYGRESLPANLEIGFAPPLGLTTSKMRGFFEELILSLEPLFRLPLRTVEKIISLKDKINDLRQLLGLKKTFTFGNLLRSAESRAEVVVSFMAILELIKQGELAASQDGVFGEIYCKKS